MSNHSEGADTGLETEESHAIVVTIKTTYSARAALLSIDFKHRPSMCPRFHAVAKFLKAEAQDDEILEEETYEDYEDYGNERPNIKNIHCRMIHFYPLAVKKLVNKSKFYF